MHELVTHLSLTGNALKVKIYFVEEVLAGGDAEVVMFHHTPYIQAPHWIVDPTSLAICARKETTLFFRGCKSQSNDV